MTEWIASIIESLGYPGLALLTFLETFLPPVPSEVVGPLTGIAVSQGAMSFVGAFLAAMVGFLAGVLPFYALGRYVKKDRLRAWADQYGKWLGITGDDIDKASAWFQRHGGKVVIAAHLSPGVRSLISIPAGIAGMNLFKFLLYTAIGKGIWYGVLMYLGTVLGDNYEQIGEFLGPVSAIVVIALVGALVAFVVWRKRQQQTSAEA